jgi:hypothetical protein
MLRDPCPSERGSHPSMIARARHLRGVNPNFSWTGFIRKSSITLLNSNRESGISINLMKARPQHGSFSGFACCQMIRDLRQSRLTGTKYRVNCRCIGQQVGCNHKYIFRIQGIIVLKVLKEKVIAALPLLSAGCGMTVWQRYRLMNRTFR